MPRPLRKIICVYIGTGKAVARSDRKTCVHERTSRRGGSQVAALAIATRITSVEIDSGYFQETGPQPLFQECSYHWRAPVRLRAVTGSRFTLGDPLKPEKSGASDVRDSGHAGDGLGEPDRQRGIKIPYSRLDLEKCSSR